MPKCDHSSVLCTLAETQWDSWFNNNMNYFWKISKYVRRSTQRPTKGMSTVHQRTIQLPLRPRKLLITDVTRLQLFRVGGDSFCEHVEALISYNIWNDGQQQDYLYIEQGHLMMPTSFMTHSMAIDPRHSFIVTWTPIPLWFMLLQGSQPWCPLGLPSSTSS